MSTRPVPRRLRPLAGLLAALLALPTTWAVAVGTAPSAGAADPTYTYAGSVSDEYGENGLNDVDVVVLPAGVSADAQKVTSARTATDTVAESDTFGEQGVYRITLSPGRYWLRFSKPTYATAYLTDADEEPATLTVGADGRISAPDLELADNVIDDVSLLLAPVQVSAPRLTGTLAVGQTVTTTLGAWRGLAIDPDYVTVEWFLNGREADDFSAGAYFHKFRIPLSAAGKKLSYRITIEDSSDLATFAPAVFTSAAYPVGKARATLGGSFRKGTLSVLVRVAGVAKPTGTVTVLKGKKRVAALRLKAGAKGKASVSLRKLRKGKHRLTLVYSGTAGIAGAKKALKIKS